MANDKDFVVNGPVVVGKDTKVTVGSITSSDIDLSTGNYFDDTLAANTTYTISNAGDVQAFQLEVTGGAANNDAWDFIGSSTFVQSFSVSAKVSKPQDVAFKPDGTKMYVLDSTADDVTEYDLSTAWDISTSVHLQQQSVISQDTTPRGFFFKPDGTKMYLTGHTDFVYEYNLTTAWDITTLSYLQSFDVSSQDTIVRNIFFRDDGIKMYMIGDSSNSVHEYDLSTAWDVSTLSHLRSDALAATEDDVGGLFFKSDGTLMYVMGNGRNDVATYELTTAWDVSTSSIVNFTSVSAQDTIPFGLFFKPDGSKAYVCGNTADEVHEYDIGAYADLSITWPSSIEWAGGVAPAAPANGETDVYTFTTDDGGTTYTGIQSIDNAS